MTEIRLKYHHLKQFHYITARISKHRKVSLSLTLRQERKTKKRAKKEDGFLESGQLDECSRSSVLNAIQALRENKLYCYHCKKELSLHVIKSHLNAQATKNKKCRSTKCNKESDENYSKLVLSDDSFSEFPEMTTVETSMLKPVTEFELLENEECKNYQNYSCDHYQPTLNDEPIEKQNGNLVQTMPQAYDATNNNFTCKCESCSMLFLNRTLEQNVLQCSQINRPDCPAPLELASIDKASSEELADQESSHAIQTEQQYQFSTDVKEYCCKYCSKRCIGLQELHIHVYYFCTQHVPDPVCSTYDTYKCEKCFRSYGSPTALRIHQRFHNCIDPLTCRWCHKRMENILVADKHENIYCTERPYVCPICSKAFMTVRSLQLHKVSCIKETEQLASQILVNVSKIVKIQQSQLPNESVKATEHVSESKQFS